MTNQECVQVFVYAKKLIAKGWTRGIGARATDGTPVHSLSEQAVRFCLVGALDRAVYELKRSGDYTGPDDYADSMYFLREHHCLPNSTETCTDFNDRVAKSKQDVLRVLDCGIAAATDRTLSCYLRT